MMMKNYKPKVAIVVIILRISKSFTFEFNRFAGPTLLQLIPFHLAIPTATIPPIEVKSPPTINSLL